MEVFGWRVLQDGVILVGVVAAVDWNAGPHPFGHGSPDGDWSLFLLPDAEYAHYCVNSAGSPMVQLRGIRLD